MLVLSRDGCSGRAKYAYGVRERTDDVNEEYHNIVPVAVPVPVLFTQPKVSAACYMEKQILQSFHILLSNIQRKTETAGFVIDAKGMHDGFMTHVLKR